MEDVFGRRARRASGRSVAGRALVTRVNVVPDVAGRALHVGIAGYPLLVARPVELAVDLAVRYVAAAAVVVALIVRFGAVRLEVEVAVDDDTADRRGLGHRPEVSGAAEAVTVVDGRLH